MARKAPTAPLRCTCASCTAARDLRRRLFAILALAIALNAALVGLIEGIVHG